MIGRERAALVKKGRRLGFIVDLILAESMGKYWVTLILELANGVKCGVNTICSAYVTSPTDTSQKVIDPVLVDDTLDFADTDAVVRFWCEHAKLPQPLLVKESKRNADFIYLVAESVEQH